MSGAAAAKGAPDRRAPASPALARRSLPSGLELVVASLPHLHTTTVTVLAKAGPRYETPRTNGLSHLCEHMLFRGTDNRPTAYELNRAIEDLGGTLEGETHVDQTLYQVALPPENVAAGLALLGEIFSAPKFEGLDVEKRIVREEILEGLDEDGREIDIDELARAQLFAPHPLGLSLTGATANVDAFTDRDLRDHFDRHYRAGNLVVSLAGPVEPGAIEELVDRSFRNVPPGPRLVVPAPPTVGGPRVRYVESSGSQTDVRLSIPVGGERDRDAVALHLLSRVLDDGLSSRLHRRITDESGLAYDAFCAVDLYEDVGILDLGATVEHDKVPEAVGALTGLLQELRDAPVSAEEVDRARRRYRWALDATLDDGEAVAQFHGGAALFDLPDTFDALAQRVAELDGERLWAAARRALDPGRLHLTMVGMVDDDDLRAARAAARLRD